MIVFAFRGCSPGITTSVGGQTVACPAQGSNQRLVNGADGISWPTPCPLFVRGTLVLVTIALFYFLAFLQTVERGVCVRVCVCVVQRPSPYCAAPSFLGRVLWFLYLMRPSNP